MRNIVYFLLVVFVSINPGVSQNDKVAASFNNEGEAHQILGLGPLSNTQSISKDPLLPEIVQHIRTKYGVHTVILFGSRARGTGTAKSDYNIIGLQKSGEHKEYKEVFKGAYIDISVYSQNFEKEDISEFPLAFFWQEAIILHQPHHVGEQFIQTIKRAFADNKTDHSQTKIDAIRLLTVDLARAQENEIREHFYRRKFLMLSLNKYFSIHNLTYMGPRKSLEWLKKYDPLTYAAFEKALAPNAPTEVLQELLVQIAGPDLDIKEKDNNNKSIADNSKIKEKYSFSKDPLIPDIVRHIQETYGAHTVILYGSRALGTATPKSDYDIVALRESGTLKETVRDLFKGIYLELHFLPDDAVTVTDMIAYLLSTVEGAAILSQKDNLGERLIQQAQKIYDKGFSTSDQIKKRIINEIKINLSKMENTTVGTYYQNLVLSRLLEYYFTLRNIYYIGTRESFRWIKKNDLTTYTLFEKAVKPGASLASTKELAGRVIAGTIYENR